MRPDSIPAILLVWGAVVLACVGRLEEAIVLTRRAVEQDPLSAPAYNNLGIWLHAADRFAEAEQAYRKTLELAPQRVVTSAYLALTVLAQDRGDEALAVARREPEEAFSPLGAGDRS